MLPSASDSDALALGWPKGGAAEESVGEKHLTEGTQSGTFGLLGRGESGSQEGASAM